MQTRAIMPKDMRPVFGVGLWLKGVEPVLAPEQWPTQPEHMFPEPARVLGLLSHDASLAVKCNRNAGAW